MLAVRQSTNKQKPDVDRQGADLGVLHLAVGLPLSSWSGPPWQATAGLTLVQDFNTQITHLLIFSLPDHWRRCAPKQAGEVLRSPLESPADPGEPASKPPV